MILYSMVKVGGTEADMAVIERVLRTLGQLPDGVDTMRRELLEEIRAMRLEGMTGVDESWMATDASARARAFRDGTSKRAIEACGKFTMYLVRVG